METDVEEHLRGGGFHWIGSKGEEWEKIFSQPMPVLPAKLAPGLTFGGEYRSEAKDEDGVSREVGEIRGKVIGFESVTVPAGVYETCVRIDAEYDYFSYGAIGRIMHSAW